MLDIYVFGNADYQDDKVAFELAEILSNDSVLGESLNFIEIKPNQDLPFVDKDFVIILDVILGLPEVRLVRPAEIDKIQLSPRTSAHDYDLGFQLKYLTKLGKLGDFLIIGLPENMDKIDYSSIQSIFKKLVAQDMQGS